MDNVSVVYTKRNKKEFIDLFTIVILYLKCIAVHFFNVAVINFGLIHEYSPGFVQYPVIWSNLVVRQMNKTYSTYTIINLSTNFFSNLR